MNTDGRGWETTGRRADTLNGRSIPNACVSREARLTAPVAGALPFSTPFPFFIASLVAQFENEEKLTVSLTFRQFVRRGLQRKIPRKCDFFGNILGAKNNRESRERRETSAEV